MAIVTGIGILWSPAFVLFYLTYPAAVSLFALFWRLVAPHPWRRRSIWGSALILFATYPQVQVKTASPGVITVAAVIDQNTRTAVDPASE